MEAAQQSAFRVLPGGRLNRSYKNRVPALRFETTVHKYKSKPTQEAIIKLEAGTDGSL